MTGKNKQFLINFTAASIVLSFLQRQKYISAYENKNYELMAQELGKSLIMAASHESVQRLISYKVKDKSVRLFMSAGTWIAILTADKLLFDTFESFTDIIKYAFLLEAVGLLLE